MITTEWVCLRKCGRKYQWLLGRGGKSIYTRYLNKMELKKNSNKSNEFTPLLKFKWESTGLLKFTEVKRKNYKLKHSNLKLWSFVNCCEQNLYL